MTLHHYPASRRYASSLEKPAPRSMLASPGFWIGGACCAVIWIAVIVALIAFARSPA